MNVHFVDIGGIVDHCCLNFFYDYICIYMYIYFHFLTEYSVIKVSNKVFQYISVESVYFLFVEHVHFHNFFPYIETIAACGQDTASPLFTPYPLFFHFFSSFPWLRNMQNSNNMPFSDCISRLITAYYCRFTYF